MWFSTLLAAVLWSSEILCSPSPLNPTHTVSTSYATYSGSFTAPYSLAFLGIPYAEPPVGNLRFRRPVPLHTNKFHNRGVIDASTYPSSCIQGAVPGVLDVGGAGSEDCLKVNIYTPFNATKSSKLPVLFYIHGGAFLIGDPKYWPFDHWINQSPNIVVVSVYYRLSSLGFFSHPSFSHSANGDNNAGILDQTEALKWVKNNIAAFGGDPRRITINGESAGGSSVQLHLVSKESNGLFHGAIGQSVGRFAMPTPEQQGDWLGSYANQAGCGNRSTSAIFKCLREAPISAIVTAQDARATFADTSYTYWAPVVDGTNFVDNPTNLFKAGKFAQVPIIVGATTDDSFGFLPGVPLDVFLTSLYPHLTAQDLTDFQTLYSGYTFPTPDALTMTAFGEILLRCAREIIGGAGVRYREPTWTYRYNQPNPYFDPPGMTGHAAENWAMFLGSLSGLGGVATFTGLNPVDKAFSQELIAYWISFVRALDPNVYKLRRSPVWPGFERGVRMVLQEDPGNTTTTSGAFTENEPSAEADRCRFIANKSNALQA